MFKKESDALHPLYTRRRILIIHAFWTGCQIFSFYVQSIIRRSTFLFSSYMHPSISNCILSSEKIHLLLSVICYIWKSRRTKNLHHLQIHWLCGLAAVSWITVIWNCFTSIRISFLHFGQNTGKFFMVVSARILSLVLLPQAGQCIQSISIFYKIPPYSNIAAALSIGYSISVVLPFIPAA